MYLPQVQPVPVRYDLLGRAAESFHENRLLKQTQELTQAATDPNADPQTQQAAFNKLLAVDPRAASVLQAQKETNRTEANSYLTAGLAALYAHKPEDRPTLYQQIKAHGMQVRPDIFGSLPEQWDDATQAKTDQMIIEAAVQGNKIAASIATNAGLIPQEQSKDISDFQAYSRLAPDQQKAYAQYKQISGSNGPASLQEYAAYQAMSPDQKREFLQVKRANPYIDAGGTYVQPDPLTGGKMHEITVTQKQAPAPPGVTPNAPVETQVQQMADVESAKESAQKTADVQVERKAGQPQAELALNAQKQNLNIVRQYANEILNNERLPLATGAVGIIGRNVPGTSTYDAGAAIDSLKAQISGLKLQAMRDASKTGGAVGQVTEREWPRLENMVAALDPRQGEEVFKKRLGEVLAYVDQIENNLDSAYSQGYQQPPGKQPDQPATGKVMTQAQAQQLADEQRMPVEQIIELAKQKGYTVQ